MTYYGRWTYKYEIAAAKGAATSSSSTKPSRRLSLVGGVEQQRQENFALDSADENTGTVPVRAWITLEQANRLSPPRGRDFAQLKAAAVKKDFKPVSLGATADFRSRTDSPPQITRTIVELATAPIHKPRTKYVIYSAHWDHLGRDPITGATRFTMARSITLPAWPAFSKSPRLLRTCRNHRGATHSLPRHHRRRKRIVRSKVYAEHHALPSSIGPLPTHQHRSPCKPWEKPATSKTLATAIPPSTIFFAQAAQRQGRVAKPNSEPAKKAASSARRTVRVIKVEACLPSTPEANRRTSSASRRTSDEDERRLHPSSLSADLG